MLKATLAAVVLSIALGGSAMAVDLPAICLKGAAMDMGSGMGTTGMGNPDEAHKDLMAGMDQMNKDMMAGGTAADIDVAFICAMIPHHQGAIDMAKAELAHGDDPWAKQMAQNVITAQEKEIADMKDWLSKQPN
jgi:uncharacterized protein (DUF305 family)